jgi:hypothetical protein
MDICTVDFDTGRVVEIGGVPWPPQPKARTENMSLTKMRFCLALATLAAVCGALLLLFFAGERLSPGLATSATSVVVILVRELATSFTWFFDGVAGKGLANPNDPPPAPLAPPTPES